MGLSSAQKQAAYRARHPDRIAAYQASDRKKEVGRGATARWRTRNPTTPKSKKPKVTTEHKRKVVREAMRRFNCKRKGYALCINPPPPPEDMLCQLCGKPDAHLNMDHDHLTGVFRGYLCRNCNMGLGKLGDTIAGLERALMYLRKTAS